VDERVVPKDHEDSNYKLALDGFLSKVFPRELWISSFRNCLS
jgi:6-phosphogluconolactonase/glucosamine-6-phosphate isomerase/deaminase